MPYLEFRCDKCHTQVEYFYRSISAGEKVDSVVCEECGGEAVKVPSVPLGFGLYGDPAGYAKPSATKRFNTKTVSQNTGNKHAA